MLCCAVMCRAMLRCAVPCFAVLCILLCQVSKVHHVAHKQVMLCCAVMCRAVLCRAVLCCVVYTLVSSLQGTQCCPQASHAVLCCAVLCCAVLCCAALFCAVLCCVYSRVHKWYAQRSALCCALMCCAVPCHAILCYVVFTLLPTLGMCNGLLALNRHKSTAVAFDPNHDCSCVRWSSSNACYACLMLQT